MEFKVGDLVRVRSDLKVGKKYGGCTLLGVMKDETMFPTSGQIVEVRRDGFGIIAYRIKGNVYHYTAEMLELVEEKETESEEKAITITREEFRTKIGKVLSETLGDAARKVRRADVVLLSIYYLMATENAEKAFFGEEKGEEQ